MSKFRTLVDCEMLSPSNGYIYKIQRGYRLPEEPGAEKIRIAYWKHRGRRGFGQYAPIMPEAELGNLLRMAVDKSVLRHDFLLEVTGRKESKGPAATYIAQLGEIVGQNDEFLHEYAREVYEEVIELLNDSIDLVILLAQRSEAKQEHSRFAVANFAWHVLMPMSYALYLNMLSGNLIGCFGELRILTESLGDCYLADKRFPAQVFFQARIQLLHQDRTSTARRLKEMGKDFVALWGKLSESWLHTRGIIDTIVNRVAEGEDWPTWTSVIPTTYSGGDLAILNELQKRVSDFRGLLTRTVDKWKKEILVERPSGMGDLS